MLAWLLAPNRAFVSLDAPRYHRTASTDPAGFVASLPDEGALDEVQLVPELLPAIPRGPHSPYRARALSPRILSMTPAGTDPSLRSRRSASIWLDVSLWP